MKKLYSLLLSGLALLLVSGLSAQVGGITVSNTTPCPGESVTVSWNAGTDGGTPFTVTVSTVAYGNTDVFGPSLFFANTVDFPVLDGETYYVTIQGDGSMVAPTNVPLIVTNEAPTIPTGFTIDGDVVDKVCETVPFALATTGGSLGTSGTIEWYADDEVTLLNSGDPYNVGGIAVPTTYKVRIEDAVCGNTTAFLPVIVDIFEAPSAAATNVALDGITYMGPVCPGTYDLTAIGGNAGDNPDTDTIFSTGTPLTLNSADVANITVDYVDGCAVAPNQTSAVIPVVAKTLSTAPTTVTTDVAGPVCSGDAVEYTANGATEGDGFVYEYQVNGAGPWITDADGVVSLNITVPTSLAFRLVDDCITTAETVSPSVDVYTLSTDVSTVTHTAGADNEICSGGVVTFTGNGGALGNAPGTVFEYQIRENGVITTPWATTTNPAIASHTMMVTAPGLGTVVQFRVNDGCTGPGMAASSPNITLAANNVAPTTLTPSIATTCGTETVTFTSDGTLGGNGAVFQFSDNPAFVTILQSGASNAYTASVSADVTIYVRILGGCNDVSGITPDAFVDFVSANTAPTTLMASATSVCAPTNVTFTVDGVLGETAVFEFSEDGFMNIDQSGPSNMYTTNVSADVTVSARISGGCNDVSPTVVTESVDFQAPSVPVVDVTTDAPMNTVCGSTLVTFTANGGTLGDNAFYEYSTDGGMNWTSTMMMNSVSITVDADTTLAFRTNGGCDGPTAAQSVSVNYLAPSVPIVNVTTDAPMNTVCGSTLVTFTANGGTLGDNAFYEYSTDGGMSWTSTMMANSVAITINADATLLFRTNGGCAGPTAAQSVSVDYLAPSVPVVNVTTDAPMNTVCGSTLVTFTANGGTLGDNAFYEYSTDGGMSWTSTMMMNSVAITVDADTTLLFRTNGGCDGPTAAQSVFVDYQEPSDISGLTVTYTDITDPMNPVSFDPNTDILCFESDAEIKVSGITIGDGATLNYRINGGALTPVNLADTTVTINDIQMATLVEFEINGSCNMIMNPISDSTINVYPEIPDVTSLTIDKDNVCANSGEVVRLKTFTSSPVGNPPYEYDWSTFNPTTGIYTSIPMVDRTADTLDVVPTTTTTYAVRIIGCNDSSAYVAQLVTVKDTSSVDGATILSSVDGAGSKVCVGNQVTFNLDNGKRGFDAELFWYSTDAMSNEVQIGLGNPFTLTVTGDTTIYARYIGECNTTVASMAKTIMVYEQDDVTMTVPAMNEEQCTGDVVDLSALTTRTPLGGTFTGANVSMNQLTVQSGLNIFTYSFNFGACSFSAVDTIIGIDSPIIDTVAGSFVDDACGSTPVGSFKVEDINNVGLTFALFDGALQVGPSQVSTAMDSIITFSGLAAGNYVVTATNGTGCEKSIPVVIGTGTGLSGEINLAQSTTVICDAQTNGRIVVNASGGVAPYQYSFVDNADFYRTANDTTGLSAASVLDIKVKDANGCVFVVGNNVGIPSNTNTSSLTIENIIEPSCFGVADGRFDAVATGPNGPYTYSLDGVNFQSESRFDSLAVDVYTVTVRNTIVIAGNNVPGCPKNFIAPLLGPDSISVVVNVLSGDPVNGYDVEIVADGGRGGFEVSLNGGDFDTDFTFNELPGGSYDYVVRDVTGCTKTGSFELEVVDAINDIDNVLSSVYPNPFNNTLTITGNNIVNADVMLTDINGKRMNVELGAEGDNVVISTADLAKGVYLVRVVNGNASHVKRVIKN